MDLSKEIAERYKKMSNVELLEVLEQPGKYQPQALALAKTEFSARQLSAEEIADAKFILYRSKEAKTYHDEKMEAVRSKVTSAGNELYETFSPIRPSIPTHEKLIRLVAIAFSLFYIFKIISGFSLLTAILKGESYGNFEYTGYIFPLLVEGFAIVLFWFRKRIGWILLVAFCSYSLLSTVYGIYLSISRLFQSPGFFEFIPAPSPVAYIVVGLYFTASILVLKRDDIREIYRIQKNDLPVSVAAGTLVGILFLMLALY